jgi:hypothetical protein
VTRKPRRRRLSWQPDSDVKDAWIRWVRGYLGRVEASIGIPDISPSNDSTGHLDWAEEDFDAVD